ncbi:amyloid-beta A4 precursor protein-binding family B member 3 isoform X2 [Heliangelus exortis]|uniref:amyloid-beta A4 precursor protein-binding family B member 3 isoform X2 n=1 Tax=Heliangelus exortis TaxID=472823 RepID=UPI003A9426C5
MWGCVPGGCPDRGPRGGRELQSSKGASLLQAPEVSPQSSFPGQPGTELLLGTPGCWQRAGDRILAAGALCWQPHPARLLSQQALAARTPCPCRGHPIPPGASQGPLPGPITCSALGLPPTQPLWPHAEPAHPCGSPEATAGPFPCWMELLCSQGAVQLGDPPASCLTLSLCTDNLWSDQSLETDPDLPPGWRKIHDSLGTYYWHVPTGTTQWQHPTCTTSPGGYLEADGEEALQGMDFQATTVKHSGKDRPIPSPMASLSRRTSLPWHGEDFQQSGEPGSKCFAVRSLGWVEIPEEDLAPGKSSIAVNNCIQQLSNSKGQGSVENWGEIMAERAIASSRTSRDTVLEPIPSEDLPLQVDVLEAVRQSMQTYEALYIGSLPVPRAMGMDVLNEAIEKLTQGPGREHWMPSLIRVSDTAMRVQPAQDDEEVAHIWECQVRYVTFLGVGRDAHTFALIVDTGRHFQCTAFWCEPDAGTISEAVQAACMVQYQKCLVAAAPGAKAKASPGRGRAGAAASGDAAVGGAKASVGSGGAAGAGARKRGLFSFLETFRLRRALLHTP